MVMHKMMKHFIQIIAFSLFITPTTLLASDLVLLQCTTPKITSYLDEMVSVKQKTDQKSIFDDDEVIQRALQKEADIKFKMPIWQLAPDANLLLGTTFSTSEENGAWKYTKSSVNEIEISFFAQTTRSNPPVKLQGSINRETGLFQASLFEFDDNNGVSQNVRKVIENDTGKCTVIKNIF